MTTIWPSWSSHQTTSWKFSLYNYGNYIFCVIAVEHKYYWPKLHQKTYKINNENTHKKYAEMAMNTKWSCLKCLKFSKKNMIKFAENHEKCWTNIFASATCLNSLLGKKALLINTALNILRLSQYTKCSIIRYKQSLLKSQVLIANL